MKCLLKQGFHLTFITSIIVGIVLLLFINCERPRNFKVAADFEPIETVYFVWNSKDSLLLIDVVSKISQFESVSLFIRKDAALQEKVKNILSRNGGNISNVTFLPKKLLENNNWIRDFGPLFITENDKLKLVKFSYHDKSNDVANYLSKKDTLGLINSKFKTLGGTREFNGLGTGIFVEEHEKIRTGKKFNRALREEELKKEFNLKKIIWLKKGIPQDELTSYGPLDKGVFPTGSGHHIDEFCRFISPNKIIMSWVTEKEANNEILKEARLRLQENFRILSKATDQDGNAFEIIKVPFAPVLLRPFYSTSDPYDYRTEVTSYVNFLITNHTVVLPTYFPSDSSMLTLEKEEFIKQVFSTHLPDKKVLFTKIGTLNSRGGGIHCISAAKPLVSRKGQPPGKIRYKKDGKL